MEGLSTLIDLGPILDQVVMLLAAALLAVGTWAVKKVSDKFGLENDDKIRQYLLSAVERGVEFGKHKAEEAVGDADWSKVDVKNEMVAYAATYVLTKVPDAVKRFNLTEEGVRDLILAKLGASNETTATTLPATKAPAA